MLAIDDSYGSLTGDSYGEVLYATAGSNPITDFLRGVRATITFGGESGTTGNVSFAGDRGAQYMTVILALLVLLVVVLLLRR